MKKQINLVPFKVFANMAPTLATRIVDTMIQRDDDCTAISLEGLVDFIDGVCADDSDDFYKEIMVPPEEVIPAWLTIIKATIVAVSDQEWAEDVRIRDDHLSFVIDLLEALFC